MKFTESHEWVEVIGKTATVGVTDYAQKELGEIVYVELPEIGKNVKAGQEAAVLESTKAASDVYSPISGKILEVNSSLVSNSHLINESPTEKGWIFKIEVSNPDEFNQLLTADQYQKSIQ